LAGIVHVISVAIMAAKKVRKTRQRRDQRSEQYQADSYLDLVDRLGHNMRRLRKKHGLSQLEAALECSGDLYVQGWQRIETGQVNITLVTLARLADALDVDPIELLRPPREKRSRR